MNKFRKWFVGLTAGYLALIILLFLLYGFQVKDGSWGSFSDVVIAVYTVLIAYTTNMLLVVGWLTSNSWLHQSNHHSAKELHQALSKLYFMVHESKTNELNLKFLKSFETLTATNYHQLSSEAKRIFQDVPTGLTHDQLSDYLSYVKPIYKETSEKMHRQLILNQEELRRFKFEVMTSSSPFAQGIEQLNIDLIGEVRAIISMKNNFHDTAKPLFDSLKVVTGYDGFKLIHIADPVQSELFNNV
ncbi:hypothetical protein I6F43_07920 [Pseudoalteromonas sp. NZS71_1]|uniref:hypothetical protein n=1 Tax=Pseudoalteromonas sp. NZS71_1 TaxID=2792072 RepID=UPI0018CF845A|nr:hypothetical protein [Pseudoalteromonas sp. NZS71_1]MBH0034607.1 hypothetical protein [Pseudoalteromonas sp. NZS71_1]